MLMASKGHFLVQIPQPMQSGSEMNAILAVGVTSMHSRPIRTTGQLFLHSCRHFLGLHFSVETMAIRVSLEEGAGAGAMAAVKCSFTLWLAKRQKGTMKRVKQRKQETTTKREKKETEIQLKWAIFNRGLNCKVKIVRFSRGLLSKHVTVLLVLGDCAFWSFLESGLPPTEKT